MMRGEAIETSDWPLRPWFLAGGMGLAGLLVWTFSDGGETVGWRMAATAFAFFGSLAAAFTVERDRWHEPALFALVVGLVMAGLAWRAVLAGEHYATSEYGFAAGVIATALALPLFQSGFLKTRFATPYERVHHNVWTDAISAGGSLAFVGASWLVLIVLGALFALLDLRFLYRLMEQGWFAWTWSSAAFGAALGIIRNEAKILGTLQALVTTILSILAVPLVVGLAVFLVAMVVSGPEVLWNATRQATPILLACAAGAWVLANAILRDSDAGMTGNRVLRWAAWGLALAILPLTAFAAVSLGTRVAQHGLSPERLWGLIAIAVACAYGLAWLVALVRGWQGGWGERLRQANLHLAAAVCGVAFVLSLPILDFGAISARNQVARLESGRVSPDDFDYGALRWDFGDAGRRALARLKASDNARVAEFAALAEKQSERIYGYRNDGGGFRTEAEIDVSVRPDDPALRKLVIDHLRANPYLCQGTCIALEIGPGEDGGREVAFIQNGRYQRVQLPSGVLEPRTEVAPANPVGFGKNSQVQIGTVEKRYILVDGQPVGPPLD